MVSEMQYIPILRWKQAERFALGALKEQDRSRITPLIELIPTMFKQRKRRGVPYTVDPMRVLDMEARRLLEACQYSPFFLDARLVERRVQGPRGDTQVLEYLASLLRDYKMSVIPVTGLSRSKEFQSSVARIAKADGRGACMRITPAEVLRQGFQREIKNCLANLELGPDVIHLIIDYEASDLEDPDPIAVLGQLPTLAEWPTLCIAGGAFPPDLQEFEPGHRRIPRTEWLAWKRAISNGKKLSRKPGFSDYTIQYGNYKEPVSGCNPSVSVRYTLPEEWLIMRGEAPRGKAGSKSAETRPGLEQWNGHAQILCDSLDLFYGEDFSWGDHFIYEMSQDTNNTGSYEIWLRAGINHHLTVVSRQIASLGGL